MKQNLTLSLVGVALISAVAFLAIGKAMDVITCLPTYHCQYNLSENGWLFPVSMLVGVAAMAFVAWLNQSDLEPPHLLVD